MKIIESIVTLGFVLFLALMMPAGIADNIEAHGTVANVGMDVFTWDNASFPGFFYDLDKNMGAEMLTFRLSNRDAASATATLSDQMDAEGHRGVVYTTWAQVKNYKFKPWGRYLVIGFLGERYFAAYDPTVTADVANAGESVAFLYDRSKNRNLMTNEQLSKILIDDNKEIFIDSSSPLKLEEGYSLAVKSVNFNETGAILVLKKNGQLADTQIIKPGIDGARLTDKTYYYKKDIGGTKEIILIAVHFKNVFHGPKNDSATVDGVFQISDTPLPIISGQKYGRMSIRNVDPSAMTITMDNKDNQIVLGKGIDIPLMGRIHIKTADQSTMSPDNPLRYYIYSEEPCKC
jgi:S-layer protein (TIGR01567 family)